MSSVAGVTELKIINTKLYVPIVTLSSKGNTKLVKLSEDGFNRPVYWNEYEKLNADSRAIQKFMRCWNITCKYIQF